MNAAAARRPTPTTALAVPRTSPPLRRRTTACCPPCCSSRCLEAITGATPRAGCRRSIPEMTRSAKSRDGDRYGSRWSSAAIGTKSSSKSCSIMDSSRMTYGVWPGLVSAFSSEFCLQKRGSSEVPQVFPELLTRPVDVRLHGPERELHDLSDLVVRVVLDVAQDDASTILGAELCNGALDLCAELPRFPLLGRGFPAARDR